MDDHSAVIDVLIVDNASTDGSGERLKALFPQHHYLQTGANLGYAGGNQRAIEWALARDYDYVLIINDDAEVQPGCLGTMVAALERNPRAGAAAPTILHHGTSIVWFAGGEISEFKAMGSHTGAGASVDTVRQREPAVSAVTFLSGCVLLLRSEAVRDCGGLSEEFFAYVEDLELSFRFRRAGWSLLQVARAVATHKVPYPEPPDSAFAIRLRDVNRRRLVRRHYSWAMRLTFELWLYPTRLIHMVRYLVRGDRSRLVAVWHGMAERV